MAANGLRASLARPKLHSDNDSNTATTFAIEHVWTCTVGDGGFRAEGLHLIVGSWGRRTPTYTRAGGLSDGRAEYWHLVARL